MSEHDADLAQVERAARELVPRLTERLARHNLGELEIRHGDLRVRVLASAQSATPASSSAEPEPRRQGSSPRLPQPGAHGVTSPAVGYFGFAEQLGPGLKVEKGDALGHVDMLGVRHDVLAPRRGTVSHLVAESGEPVEYGQVLVELEPGE